MRFNQALRELCEFGLAEGIARIAIAISRCRASPPLCELPGCRVGDILLIGTETVEPWTRTIGFLRSFMDRDGVVLIVVLIAVCWWKGEAPRWRWA
jgi:hypothetical protein